MADKGWTKYQDDIEVAELGKAYDEAIAELSTARDQLAEMREQMIAIARLLREAQRILDSYGFANFSREVDKALSAAPAGGRVLCRLNGGWDTEIYGEEEPILWLPHKSNGLKVEAVRGDLDERHGKAVIATITEPPPKEPEDDEWPRECPRCGAAGGSELGPCPMCKGAGFVDEE